MGKDKKKKNHREAIVRGKPHKGHNVSAPAQAGVLSILNNHPDKSFDANYLARKLKYKDPGSCRQALRALEAKGEVKRCGGSPLLWMKA